MQIVLLKKKTTLEILKPKKKKKWLNVKDKAKWNCLSLLKLSKSIINSEKKIKYKMKTRLGNFLSR